MQKQVIYVGDSTERIDLTEPFYTKNLITYIGNKRKLLPFLYRNFLRIQASSGKRKLRILDGFSGSGAVARLLKSFASELYVNDLEGYSETLNRAYLSDPSYAQRVKIAAYIDWLNVEAGKSDTGENSGFIESQYAPKNDEDIQPGERVFYTRRNARIIDLIRRRIDSVPPEYRPYCLAPLLVKASIHTNTSGIFKSFHKKDGIGHFGGRKSDALYRIKKDIVLDEPVFSGCRCPVHVFREDVNELVKRPELRNLDLAYFDPPYNRHPYGSNYFMLNVINDGGGCDIQEGVGGIAVNWRKSRYNMPKSAASAFADLIRNTDASFIAVSYSNEGIIPVGSFKRILSEFGTWEVFGETYHAYRGSRNFRERTHTVKELLWVLKKERTG